MRGALSRDRITFVFFDREKKLSSALKTNDRMKAIIAVFIQTKTNSMMHDFRVILRKIEYSKKGRLKFVNIRMNNNPVKRFIRTTVRK